MCVTHMQGPLLLIRNGTKQPSKSLCQVDWSVPPIGRGLVPSKAHRTRRPSRGRSSCRAPDGHDKTEVQLDELGSLWKFLAWSCKFRSQHSSPMASVTVSRNLGALR